MIRKSILVGILAAALAAAPTQAQEAEIGGSFMLQDHLGRVVRDDTFIGKYLLVYFGYTFCPDVCPTGLQTLGQALDQLGDDAQKVQALFITVDPERDTSKVLRDYVAAFHPSLIGLTGPRDFVDSAIRKYKVKAEKVPTPGSPGAYTVDHTASVFLMDPGGRYLRRYPHGMSAEEIVKDLRSRFEAAPK